ncbi:DUF971 domain-containing protein [Mitsuaria sp. GD03876]|uniref:DUF971 domain-containing protein n=1 Tax=Mitsuaria sp. GD03876 TaxID=2975399 RepID=UPI00244ADA76|nr:DUF971 domain-containing protein [Mitsuaria sp. GD03876]MDH0864558.1 DUF971 domain-containing protein [Mitsuaria sp. GD03876]
MSAGVQSASEAPEGIEVAGSELRLRWSDGELTLSATSLRAACRCAHCVAASRRGEASVVDPGIRLIEADLVGHYALRLGFSDGHARGIYPWSMLRDLARAPAPAG